MHNIAENKKIYWVFVTIIFALFLVRIVNIDQDVAPWGVSIYQPADEGPYAYLAINEKIYGTIQPTIMENGEKISMLISNNFITNIVGNGLNIAGFHLFGNNYYALRIPYVLIGLVNLILFWLLLRKVQKIYGKGNSIGVWAELALLLWMVLDFTFFNASRIVEPTSVRLIFVQLTALIFLSKPDNHTTRFLWMGLVITFSCFLVYITNAFLYLAVGLVMLIRIPKNKAKTFWKEMLWFVIGCGIMFVVAEVYYRLVWGTEAVKNAISTVMDFSKNSSAELTVNSEHSIPYTLALLYARVISSNPFFYNLPFLFGSIVLLAPTIRMIRKREDERLCFLLMIVAAFMLQTLVSADTITRKMIVVFPVLVALLYAVLISGESLRSTAVKGKKRIHNYIFSAAIWGFAIFNVMFSVLYRTQMYYWTEYDFDTKAILIVLGLEVIPLGIMTVFGFLASCGNQKTSAFVAKRKVALIAVCWGLMCLSNIAYEYRYYWKNPTFTEKQAMMDLAEQADGQYVLGGGFQLGYTLYNKMKPVVNTGEETMRNAERLKNECLFLDYENDDNELTAYFYSEFYAEAETPAYFIPMHMIQRGYQVFGTRRNMSLYRIANAGEYKQYLMEKMEEAKVVFRKLNDIGDEELNKEQQKEYEQYQAWMYPCHPSFDTAKVKEDNNTPLIANVCGMIRGNLYQPVYGDILGSVFGNIEEPVHGSVYGDIYGDVNAKIDGNVYGKVYGAINVEIGGRYYDQAIDKPGREGGMDTAMLELYNDYSYSIRPIYGVNICSVIGDVEYPIYCNVVNVFGDVKNEIYGNVYGNIYGEVKAAIHGKVYGTVYGAEAE